MNVAQKITEVFSDKTTALVPIIGNLFEHRAKFQSLSIRKYYNDGVVAAKTQLLMQAPYGNDNIWGFSYIGLEAEAPEVPQIIYNDDSPPILEQFPPQPFNYAELFSIQAIFTDNPCFMELARYISSLEPETSGRIPELSALPGSYIHPSLLMGTDKWLEMQQTGMQRFIYFNAGGIIKDIKEKTEIMASSLSPCFFETTASVGGNASSANAPLARNRSEKKIKRSS